MHPTLFILTENTWYR